MWKYFDHQGNKVWFDILDLFVENVNSSVNRSIGMAPEDVARENSYEVFAKLYGQVVTTIKSLFKKGDKVRISKYSSPFVSQNKKTFRKGYRANFSKELFTIVEVDHGSPNMYKLLDEESGEVIPGRFYEPELSLFDG